MKVTRDQVVTSMRQTFAGAQTIDTWIEYFDTYWGDELNNFDAATFILHSWDHEYIETDDFEATRAKFIARLVANADLS